jgi:hypothetical protein
MKKNKQQKRQKPRNDLGHNASRSLSRHAERDPFFMFIWCRRRWTVQLQLEALQL